MPDDKDALVTYNGIVVFSLNVVFPLPEFIPPVKRFVVLPDIKKNELPSDPLIEDEA
jgi:hypothetical protein